MALPIGTRLTVWYSAVLLLILLIFGAGAYLSVRSAIETSIDAELQDRLAGVQGFMQQEIPRFPKARLWHEFQESVQMRPGGEMMQISDSSGAWIFQSESIRGLKLPAPTGTSTPALSTPTLQGVPVRIRTAQVLAGGENYTVQLATTLGPPYAALNRFFWAMLGFVPLLLLAAAAGGYWLSQRALAPVGKIIEDSRTISFGNLSRRLMVPQTGDELQRLSETLNEMIQRLEAAFLRIAQFTADASHELRTPVAFLRTTAEVALLQPRDPASYRAALADMLSESERMTRLIEELLVLARTDSGSSQLDLTALDIRDPLRYASAQGEALAQRKHIRYSTEIPDHGVSALGDSTALRRLFLILIENAIKYTPSGGSVQVRLKSSDAGPVVVVRDSGIGIPDKELDRIFDRFYRSERARQCDSGGSGLGLSIGRWIAEAHRAQIQVESCEDQGSEFRIHFTTLA